MPIVRFIGMLSVIVWAQWATTGGPVAAQAPDSGRGLAVRLSESAVPGTAAAYDVQGRPTYCTTYGKGSPTVVLITGFGAPQQVWAPVIGDLAKTATVFTYDRAGYGRSEAPPGDAPIDGGQSADDLWRLLEKAKVPAPYVVVGHSMGVDIARLFASAHPDRVCGLILEDGSHEDLRMETHRDAMEGKDREVVKQMAKGAPGLSGVMKREFLGGDRTKELLRGSPPLPRVPFVVLTSGARRAPPMLSEAGQKTWTEIGLAYQKKLAALIPGGRHVVVEKAGHIIHQDDPGALIGAVEWTIAEARKRSLVRG